MLFSQEKMILFIKWCVLTSFLGFLRPIGQALFMGSVHVHAGPGGWNPVLPDTGLRFILVTDTQKRFPWLPLCTLQPSIFPLLFLCLSNGSLCLWVWCACVLETTFSFLLEGRCYVFFPQSVEWWVGQVDDWLGIILVILTIKLTDSLSSGDDNKEYLFMY